MEQIDLSNIIVKHESNYLASQPKVKIVPDDLAILIGVSQTMMLCQMDFLIKAHRDDDHFRDGRYWVYETYDDWKEQFPYWGLSKIRDILSRLEKVKLITTGNYNKMKGDNTKWYTINYNLLDQMIEKYHAKIKSDSTPSVENQQMPLVENQQVGLSETNRCHLSKTNRPIPNISIPNISIHNNSIPNNSIPNNSVLEGSNFRGEEPQKEELPFDIYDYITV